MSIATLAYVYLWIVAIVVDNLEGEVSTTRGINTDIGYGKQSVYLAAYLAESRNTTQQSIGSSRVANRGSVVPIFFHQLVHLVVLILLEGEIFSIDDHITQFGNADIAVAFSIIFYRSGSAANGFLRIGRKAEGYQHKQQKCRHNL